VQPGKDSSGRRSFLARRRACSARFRVARVSRLIGYFDTTAKHSGWQVHFGGRLLRNLRAATLHGIELDSVPGHAANSSKRKNATPKSGVSLSCAGHWPPKYRVDGSSLTVPTADFPAGHPFFEGRFVGDCSCRASALLWAGRISPSSLHITGAYRRAIGVPFVILFYFINLLGTLRGDCLDSGRPDRPKYRKSSKFALSLAMRAIVRATPTHQNSPNRRIAFAAG